MRNKIYRIIILCTLIPGVILALGTITECKKVNDPQPEAVSKKQSKFIAVASKSDKAAYSEDGINWTEIKMPSVADRWSVCYGNGMFIAIDSGWDVRSDKVAYSEDGINWKATSLPNKEYWSSFRYGNGKFVTIASNKAAYSLDGITWTAITIPNGAWKNICFGNGKFVTISWKEKAAYSEDGINWKAVKLPFWYRQWDDLCYGNGKFVAVAYYSGEAIYSKDGSEWFEIPSFDKVSWGYSFCYAKGKFVTANTYEVIYSEDGINWKTARLPVTEHFVGHWAIRYGNERFVAIVMGTHVGGCDIAMYSEDGIHWKKTKMPFAFWESFCYGNGKFLATGCISVTLKPSDIAAYSEDGITWKEIKMPSIVSWSIYYCGE